jgi:hypothetical protein
MKHEYQLRPTSSKLRYFTLYESDEKFYLVGCDNAKSKYRFLKIDKQINHVELDIHQDVGEYSAAQMNKLLQMISSTQKGGLRTRVKRAFGLLGFIRFTQAYHMILITQRQRMGNVGSGQVFEIRNTEMINMSRDEPPKNTLEQRYKDTFMSMDLTHDFYFSYMYDLSRPLQQNMSRDRHDVQNEMFIWNSFLMEPLTKLAIHSYWMLPIIHGYFGQTRLSVVGRAIDVVLIARRSRYFAGTRYLKRGINDSGHVANHVETEQIVFDANSLYEGQSLGLFSSYVQTRGSIPLYWSQTIVTKVVNPKPDILLGKFDPSHTSAHHHFEQLMNRHGQQITCLDLVKRKEKKPREGLLGSAYEECIRYMNQSDMNIHYMSWDFRRAIKDKPERALNELAAFAEENLRVTGLFYAGATDSGEQGGVIRTNCIDCLDRTNIVQFFIGKYALGQQLHALQILDTPHLVYHSNVVRALMELYDSLGDKIALQYGGSRTVSAGINHRGFSWDIMTSLRRYYSNNFKDASKQHAINLFLGNYRPRYEKVSLWDLDSDHALHDRSKMILVPSPTSGSNIDHHFLNETYDRYQVTDIEPLILSTVSVSEPDDQANESSVIKEEEDDTPNTPTSPIDRFMSNRTIPQSQLLRGFEDKMDRNQISVLDPIIENKSTLFEHVFHSDKEQSWINDKQCTEHYSRYLNEFVDSNDKSTQFTSPMSQQNQTIYEQYLQPSTTIDETIYQDYTMFSQQYKPVLQKNRVHSNVIPTTLPVHNATTRLRTYYPTCTSNEQLYNKLLHLLSIMKQDLSIMDRVRHPRPAKKLFNQTPLFELLKGRLYRKCFLSGSAIDWLLKHKHHVEYGVQNRHTAQDFMQLLLECHLIRHVSFAKLFLDGHYLYKFTQDDSVRVLNLIEHLPLAQTDPLQLSMDLVQEISDIYRSLLNSDGVENDIISVTQFLSAIKTIPMNKSRRYRAFMDKLVQLSSCDLTLLAPLAWTRIAFFINIYHCLLLHGLLLMGGSAKNRVQGKAMHSFYTRTCYVIGGYRFSLSDIRDGVLRNNKCFPGALHPTFTMKNDPRAALCVNEMRLLFLLHESETVWRSRDELRIKLHRTVMTPKNDEENPLFIPVGVNDVQQILNRVTAVFLQENITISHNTITLTKNPFALPDFGSTVDELLDHLIQLTEYLPPSREWYKKSLKDSLTQLLQQHAQGTRSVLVQYSNL